MPQTPVGLNDPPPLGRLTRRADFLAAARGAKKPAPGCVVQMRVRGDADRTVRLGFTASKKIGGAVVRNRAKRRLREAARQMAPRHAQAGCDYVFIARAATAERPWGDLLDDVKRALISLAPAAPDPTDGPASSPR